MKQQKIFLAFLLTLSLIVVGCGSEEATQAKTGAFLGGSEGVKAEFQPFGVEEEGVFTIFDSETFPIEVTVHNKGEYEIVPSDITVKLLGPSQEEFSGIANWELKNADTIEKISELVQAGGEETLSFGADVAYTGKTKGFIDREWFANIDYNYKTSLIIPEVCLKEDLTDDRVCEVKGTKDFFVSGAPITVKAVEESTAGKGIMALKIQVENVGTGKKVTKPGEDFGVRDKFAFNIDDAAWECKSGGKVNEGRLVEGKAEVVCKLKKALAEDALSTKQVQLDLFYKYREIIQETLRIKESAE